MTAAVDPLDVPCSCCLAQPGEQCHATSSDLPRALPHRLRGLAAERHLTQCDTCHGVGWTPTPATPAPPTPTPPTGLLGRARRWLSSRTWV